MHNTIYQKYLKSVAWRTKRAKYWASVGGKQCQACGSKRLLQVHHLTYVRLGHEDLKDLAGLCSQCHSEVHLLSYRMGGKLEEATNKYIYLKRMERSKGSSKRTIANSKRTAKKHKRLR